MMIMNNNRNQVQQQQPMMMMNTTTAVEDQHRMKEEENMNPMMMVMMAEQQQQPIMNIDQFNQQQQFNMTTPTQHHLLCGQYGLTRRDDQVVAQERKVKKITTRSSTGAANTYKIRDDFIIETNYYDFHHKVEKAFDNINQPAFVTHRAYPTNQKKAQRYNADTKHNQDMFKMISKNMCEGSRRVFQEENAGGCSVFSEVISCEIVTRMFNAKLSKTEMEIDYVNEHCKKTDFLVVIGGKKYGVSVTRAFKYRKPTTTNKHHPCCPFDDFTMEDARVLLKKKLEGVTTANKCVQNDDVWQKQILHIFTPNANVTKVLRRAYMNLKHTYRHNTIVMVTETTNMDCIFTERLYDHIF